jgi:hypothetical protein
MALAGAARAQVEGVVPTQALVNVDAKSTPPADPSVLTVSVDNKKESLSAWAQVLPVNAQVALLIDDGLRESIGREIGNLRSFVGNLTPGIEIMVGYMQNGHVVEAQPFTTDHTLAATTLHLPDGIPGMSASPYICLSDLVKKWPASGAHKARFAIMITDGVDPYNGSTSVMNQDSPYVKASIEDAQRAGVAVSAIYFSDAGITGNEADNSGQSYLAQLTQATGGVSYWEGVGNPVSMAPFLKMFQAAIAETYVATFNAPLGKDPTRDMVHVNFSAAKVKLHTPNYVRPGNVE